MKRVVCLERGGEVVTAGRKSGVPFGLEKGRRKEREAQLELKEAEGWAERGVIPMGKEKERAGGGVELGGGLGWVFLVVNALQTPLKTLILAT